MALGCFIVEKMSNFVRCNGAEIRLFATLIR